MEATDHELAEVMRWRETGLALAERLDLQLVAFDPQFLLRDGQGRQARIPVWVAERILKSRP